MESFNQSIPKEKWESEDKDLVKKAQAIFVEINIQTKEIGRKLTRKPFIYPFLNKPYIRDYLDLLSLF